METRSAPIFMPNAPYIIYEVVSTPEMDMVTNILGRYIWPNTPNQWDVVEKLTTIPVEIVDKAISDINDLLVHSCNNTLKAPQCFWALFFDPNSIASIFVANKQTDIWYSTYTIEPYELYLNYRFLYL